MRVEVFKTDICHGEQNECKTCVVARAINRKLPEGYFSIVTNDNYDIGKKRALGLDVPYWDYDVVVKRVPLNRTVGNYIRRFDKNRKSVCPTVLDIEIPALP